MIGPSPHNRASSIELLQEHDQGQLMLERHGGKSPQFICGLPHFGDVPVRPADKEGRALQSREILSLNPLGKVHATELPSSFVQYNAT